MNLSDFDFILPKSRIAQHPLPERDASRLMVLDRAARTITHRTFRDVVDYLCPADCLVINTSRVFPARLFGTVQTTGAQIEVFVVRETEDGLWDTMVYPGKKAAPGVRIKLGENGHEAEVVSVTPDGRRLLKVNCGRDEFWQFITAHGHVPLPPYIDRDDEPGDRERYQTVYARESGSVAAPTAGLHFTPQLLEAIKQRGVQVATVVLHVGPGTFKPVKTATVEEHRMDREYFSLPAETAAVLRNTRAHGGKIWAVGTTATRVLETVGLPDTVKEYIGWTEAFICPGYTFKVVDGLVTNFHLPRSTLLMLVSALAGTDFIKNAYREAVEREYRFYSYGDAMLIC
jgi:S-adenosylmethionine:tRNA ribosyltransferase-isomerase